MIAAPLAAFWACFSYHEPLRSFHSHGQTRQRMFTIGQPPELPIELLFSNRLTMAASCRLGAFARDGTEVTRLRQASAFCERRAWIDDRSRSSYRRSGARASVSPHQILMFAILVWDSQPRDNRVQECHKAYVTFVVPVSWNQYTFIHVNLLPLNPSFRTDSAFLTFIALILEQDAVSVLLAIPPSFLCRHIPYSRSFDERRSKTIHQCDDCW